MSPLPSTPAQSTATPRTNASANEASRRSAPPLSRRSVPTVTGEVSSSVAAMAWISTGCGDVSTNTPCPDSPRIRIARSNSTVSRSEANQ